MVFLPDNTVNFLIVNTRHEVILVRIFTCILIQWTPAKYVISTIMSSAQLGSKYESKLRVACAFVQYSIYFDCQLRISDNSIRLIPLNLELWVSIEWSFKKHKQFKSNSVCYLLTLYIYWSHEINISQWEASCHDDVIKWKHLPRNWPFVRGIHRSRWIPHTKASDAELWCFLWSASENTVE